MPARKQGAILIARESGAVTLDGATVNVRADHTRVREGHPLLKVTPAEWWEPMTAHFDIEQTTAAPGEKRGEPVRAAQ